MSLKFRCKNCGNDIVVQFLTSGEIAKCKHCGEENIVPTDTFSTDELPSRIHSVKSPPGQPEQRSFPTAPVKLTSKSTGKGLIVLLWVELGWSVLLLIILTIAVMDSSVTNLDVFASLYSSASIFGSLDYPFSTLILIRDLLGIAFTIVFLVWMYLVHSDLAKLYPGYVIRPGQALARLLIPFYNIWGIWNVYATLSHQLKEESGELYRRGSSLYLGLVIIYASCIIMIIVFLIASIPGVVSSGWTVFGAVLDVFTDAVIIYMTMLIRSALRYRTATINKALSSGEKQ